MKNPYPTVEALSALVRAEDKAALAYVRDVLKAHGGNARETARAIGCSPRTLHNWRVGSTKLDAIFEKHALGREGAGVIAGRSRRRQSRD